MGSICSTPKDQVDEVDIKEKVEVSAAVNNVDDEESESIQFDAADILGDENLDEEGLLIEGELNVCVTSIRPWIGAIFEPDNAPAFDGTPPDADLDVEWIYGYRCHDSRNNIALLDDGSIAYPQAALVVNYYPDKHEQTYMKGHNDDVMCLAQGLNNRNIIASGQIATLEEGKHRRSGRPFICVTNMETGETVKIRNAAKRCVRCVDVSMDGSKVCCVGHDNSFTAYVYDAASGALLGSDTTSNNKVLDCIWSNVDENEFYVCGAKNVARCTVKGYVEVKQMLFGKYRDHSRVNHYCMCMTGKGMLLTGTNKGYVCCFNGGKCIKAFRVSKRAIYSIERIDMDDDQYLVGGSAGVLYLCDKKMNVMNKFKIGEGEKICSIKANGQNVVIGTMEGNIYKSTIDNLGNLGAPILQGHSDGELWGICQSTENPDQFVTAGEDNKLMVWSKGEHKCIAQCVIDEKRGKKKKRRRAGTTSTLPPNQCARAISCSPKGDYAVGVNSGVVHVYDAGLNKIKSINLNKYGKRKVKNQEDNWIEAMAYSPDGSVLAVGTHGMVICLLDVNRDYKCCGRLTAHNAPICNLDWSTCGQYIQSVSIAHELLFHTIDTDDLQASDQNKNPSSLTGVEWLTQSCKFGWPVQGVFGFTPDGTDVNRCAKDADSKYLFTATDWGRVDMFRYPALDGAEAVKARGHSSHVTNVICSGRQVLSTGGNDKAVIQWNIV